MNEHVQQAITILKQGGIIIFPTDTAFGIGCNINNEQAVERLFELRKRPETKATPVLVSSIDMAQKYLSPIPLEVKAKLIDKYWPGALTIVLPCQEEKVPNFVRGGGHTLGVRMPNHQIVLEIMSQGGVPLLGPSANFAGEKTPYAFEELDKELMSLVDYVVPGNCTLKQASTVIDCSQVPWQIRRNGAVQIII